MRIEGSGLIGGYGASLNIGRAREVQRIDSRAAKVEEQDFLRMGELLRNFRRVLFDGRTRVESTGRGRRKTDVRLESSSALGLTESARAAALRSSGALGVLSNAHAPGTPTWSAASKPVATLGGTYDGSNGDQTLTIRVASGGIVGTDELALEVLDEGDNVLERVTVASDYVQGTELALANGLTLKLAAGSASVGDEFDVDVAYASTGPQSSFTPPDPTWSALAKPTTTVGGTYDGSNGSQTLTLRVSSGGTVGADALVLDVLDEQGALLEQVNVASDYVADTELALSNGLTVSLGAGVAALDDEFTLDVAYTLGPDENSFTPGTPTWSSGSEAVATLGGAYDGSNGSQRLTFRVAGEGTVGASEVLIDVLDEQGALLEQLTVAADYAPSSELALANGLTLSLGAGLALGGDEFTVDVVHTPGAPQSSFTPNAPTWSAESKPTPTLGGVYDGSNGSQTLTLRVSSGGTLGTDALTIDVLDAQGSLLEQLSVASDYTPGTELALANGLTLTLGSGLAADGDEFTVDVAYDAGGVQSSFTPDEPSWTSTSKPLATVAGAYDGSNGSQTLTLRVASGGTVGADALTIDVLDEQGAVLEQLSVASDYAQDTELALANGLTLSLGAGVLGAGDEFTVDVVSATAVDPEQAFDGSGGTPPSFANGEAVTDGAFELNGVAIDVYGSDSIESVLARINASAAGVTATFDANASRVVLTHDTPGATGDIVVANDTSGFLAAVQLDAATLEAGADGELVTSIGDVDSLAEIDSGTLRVNGQAVAIDVQEDSLADVVARLAALGVELDYSDDTQRFELHTRGKLELDDGDTGFFASLGISDGRYGENPKSNGFARSDDVSKALKELAQAWNQLFDTKLSGGAERQTESLRNTLKRSLEKHFAGAGEADSSGGVRTAFGFAFEFGPGGQVDFVVDDQALERALHSDAARLEELLLGSDDREGLFDVFTKALIPTASALDSIFESRGLATLDLYA